VTYPAKPPFVNEAGVAETARRHGLSHHQARRLLEAEWAVWFRDREATRQGQQGKTGRARDRWKVDMARLVDFGLDPRNDLGHPVDRRSPSNTQSRRVNVDLDSLLRLLDDAETAPSDIPNDPP
jgi:hypothetical protein